MSNSEPAGEITTMEPAAGPQPGQPRSEHDAEFLRRFDSWMRLPIIISAILPIVVVPDSRGWVGIAVGVVTWLVFVLDYVVHARHLEQFGRTRYGQFDLFVVIATAPWFLLPGAQATRFIVLLRLARLARIVMASRASRRLFDQLGRVALVAGGVTLTGSLIAYYAEHPTNPEFASVGDALWWGVVTLTTVGYGDIVPKTTTGRWAAVTIMLTGIAVLGLLSGSLASFFRLERDGQSSGEAESEAERTLDEAADGDNDGDAVAPTMTAAAREDPALTALTAEVSALRRQVEALGDRIAVVLADRPTGQGPTGGSAPG